MPRTMTPAEIERQRKAGRARHSVDTYIKSLVDRAPELTDEQVAKLRAIFALHDASSLGIDLGTP